MENTLAQPQGLRWGIRIGRFWFQKRSFSPLPILALIILLPQEFKPSSSVTVLSMLAILISEGLRLWAVGYAGSSTRTRSDTVPRLVSMGPYRHVRNPLYIANITMYTACTVLFGFKILAFLTFLYSCLQYSFIVQYEEALLMRLFGPSYLTYQNSVPRWIPSLQPNGPMSAHRFSLRQAVVSEKSTFSAMFLVGLIHQKVWRFF